MKSLLLNFLLSTFIISISTAQGINREVFPRQVSIEHNQAVRTFSRDFATAFSNNFIATKPDRAFADFSQLSAINILGDANYASLLQKGFNNAGIINIRGNRNEAKVKQQGQYLFSIVNLLGDDNQLTMNQQGVGQISYLQLMGSGINFDAFQSSSGMKLIQSGTGIPLIIQHRGRPLPIIIRSNQ